MLRAAVLPCLESSTTAPVAPLAAEIFAQRIESFTNMPTAMAGKAPSDAEITRYQDEQVPGLKCRFGPALLALREAEFAEFETSQAVANQNAQQILHSVFDNAHDKLISR